LSLNRLLFTLALAAVGKPCIAQESARDTTRIMDAEVLEIRIPVPLEQAAPSVSTLSRTDLQNGYSPDLQDALNTLPGVQMDTRGLGGSRRLQIRSSGLRSPFGVRNVQMVMDGFILTNASGNAPLELWNPQWIHRLEVLRGPIGAVFGNGYGGALVAQSLPQFDDLASEIRGYGRFAQTQETGFSYTSVKDHSALITRAFWSENSGYRDQEANTKHQAEIHYLLRNSPKSTQHFWTGWMQAQWELPGSLNREDFVFNPRRAPGSDYDAHVFRERTWAAWGMVQEKIARSGFWLYSQWSQKTNPYGTSRFYNGDKAENETFVSARFSRVQSWPLLERGKISWDQSAMARFERFSLTERDLYGEYDRPRYEVNSNTSNFWIAQSGRLEFNDRWRLDAQIGLEHFGRDSDGTRRVLSGITDSLAPYFESYAGWELTPFAQLSYEIRPEALVFLQFGTGTNHPTSFELVDPLSYAPADLTAELAHSWESGIRWHGEWQATQGNLALLLYHQNVSNAIALVPGPSDGLFMANVDGLVMNGIEFSGQATHTVDSKSRIDIRFWGNLNQHAFRPFAQVVPGTPLHTAGSSGTIHHGYVSIGWQHEWYDRVKLHDDKNDWSSPHHRLNGFVSLGNADQRWQFGVRNLLDSTYSSWLQTNAFGGKYFNPAPPRQFWLSWTWTLPI